jgi:hypothetical protein
MLNQKAIIPLPLKKNSNSMPSLASKLRKDLENAVKQARRAAETGAGKALDLLAVGHHEPWGSMKDPEQRRLRNRLRAHGVQLGDARDDKRGTQSVTRLTGEVAYEQWHRMLFARYLAENELLIEPESGQAMSMDECRELAREQGKDWLPVACGYAEAMLPEIFRRGDPVLEVTLPPETRSELEDVLNELPRDVFVASDSLGWVYQFWQADRKDEVNASGNKIGADELPSVTQLFTEDYMVDFLLDNTLGAWHAGKVLAANPSLAATAKDEIELRAAVALPGCPWNYLRFIKGTDGKWTPAAGTFAGWPKSAAALRALDPCMGSGHFVVAMFERLVALRLAEEKLAEAVAVDAVIRDNLFGLEIDPRCTQIGAFNLALAAWRRVGYRQLPPMNVACSGLAPNTREADWLAIAGNDGNIQNGMSRLYRLFKNAPVLGSLINPRSAENELLESAFHELQPLLEKALAKEAKDDAAHEMAVTARGLAKAAEILAGQFTLVATNVPYLGRGKQDDELKDYCECAHPKAKADLATCFVERSLEFCQPSGSIALVTPQNWWFLSSYADYRRRVLEEETLHVLATLGEEAWQSFGDRGPMAALIAASRLRANASQQVCAIDALPLKLIDSKINELLTGEPIIIGQDELRSNPDSRLAFDSIDTSKLLANTCESWQGLVTSDNPRFMLTFWEVWGEDWKPYISSPTKTRLYGGRENVIYWVDGSGPLHLEGKAHNFPPPSALGRKGILLSQVRSLSATIYTGEIFANGSSPVIPADERILPALWCFISTAEYQAAVRNVDKKTMVTNGSLLKVEFDLAHWQKVAAEKYPHGMPKPVSSEPTQWLFNGHPAGADQPLQVAVARLVGYQWPRQTGSSFPDCPALKSDGLEKLADKDGIVCLSATKGEAPAADRLNALLAAAFGSEWSATKARELLSATDSDAKTLADWLSDDFFAQHCEHFHQRPFIWHISDGLKSGFSALVNYHRLAAGDGAGKRTLDKLIFTYLGEWIDAQRKAQKAGVEGADARLTAAEHLSVQLKAILVGEPPFDLFVRWKPLHEQPIGWNPDINDGVRLNLRPFITAKPLNARGKNACILRSTPKVSWDKDRGKEPQRAKADFPWFWSWEKATDDQMSGKQPFLGTGSEPDGNRWNDCHYSTATKQAARERHAHKR